MDYSEIRTVHLISVVISIALFALRAVLAEMEINWRSFAWLRLVPQCPHQENFDQLRAQSELCSERKYAAEK